ncbi:MAG: hypothetical protein J3T61_00500 [Candidatus Brocadiales bacterium]|nr:hypothetical protein [Candidatus Bathyanammoxibius sp.]
MKYLAKYSITIAFALLLSWPIGISAEMIHSGPQSTVRKAVTHTADISLNDNVQLLLGTDSDCSFDFDGSDLVLACTTEASRIIFDLANTTGNLIFDNSGSTAIKLQSAEAININPSNLSFFGGSLSSGFGQVSIKNAAAPPTSIGINSTIFWAEDISASSGLHIMDESTNVFVFANGTFYGNIASGGDLTLQSTTNATKGNIILNDFAKLGAAAPGIKIKKLTGTTGATEGDATDIIHGLTMSKIIGISVLVNNNTNTTLIPPELTSPAGFQYSSWVAPTLVKISLHATNSEDILSSAIVVLVTYEE